ncbi:MAG: metal ABC transporter permease [Thermoguttaceae bacterium]
MYDIIFSPDYTFVRTAFLISALASLSFGVIGTFVVVRRIGYIASAISHCAFGGIGIGLFLQQFLAATAVGFGASKAFASALETNMDPIYVAVLFAVLAALVIGAVQIYGKEREDTIIGTIWSVGMAVGLLFLDRTSGYVSISSFLFGDILFTSSTDLYLVAVLDVLVLATVAICFKKFEAVCFDEEFVRLRGVRTGFYFQLLLVLVAITVVLMIRIVGIILVIAMLTLPAATAARLTNRLLPMSVFATIICFFCSWIGLYLSVIYIFSAGPVIILVAAALYGTVMLIKR